MNLTKNRLQTKCQNGPLSTKLEMFSVLLVLYQFSTGALNSCIDFGAGVGDSGSAVLCCCF